ncbi:transient receptor potential channel pyrexia-like isoform X2 [Sitophilus oryzae]|nr:transient receptor potential channel pyrexia-like isoform X2 [Sitophilus oryzae]
MKNFKINIKDPSRIQSARNRFLNLVSCWKTSKDETSVVLKDYRSSKEEFAIEGCGSPPSTEYIFDFYENVSTNNQQNIPLHYELIKLNLVELTKFISGKSSFFDDIDWQIIGNDNLEGIFKDVSEAQLNVSFLWSAFIQRWDLLEGFLKLGASIDYYEPTYGLGALHLAAFSGCTFGVEYLLSHIGSDPNVMYKCYTPLHCAVFGNSTETAKILLKKGAHINLLTNDLQNSIESVLHCAVRANAVDCLKLLCDEGANVMQQDAAGKTSIHLASELGCNECLTILIKQRGADVNVITKDKQQTPLHLGAENKNFNCISILLENNASPDLLNYKEQTALHLAAKAHAYKCVKLLLKEALADPNAVDVDQRTPLHSAACKSSKPTCETIKILLMYGAKINSRDRNDCTPLHLAILNEAPECVNSLILCGADLTAKLSGHTALGMICRKTPMCVDTIRKKMDESVTFSNQKTCKEIEVRMDFTPILQHCYPRETTFLFNLIEENQKELLVHPLCTAFLFLKWKKIRKYYISRAIYYFLFVVMLSSYIMTGLAYNCYNFSKNITDPEVNDSKKVCFKNPLLASLISQYPRVIEIQWYILLILCSGILVRKICGLTGYSSLYQYFSRMENFFDWSIILSVFLVSFVYTGRTYEWQNHISAFAVLLAWSNLMITLGQLPIFGPYVCMYISVQSEFTKVFSIFSCLLVGFTISFCIIFPESQNFSNFFNGFITVLAMSIGELDLDLIIEKNDPYELEGSTQVVYTLFILCVTIILLNLLLGIAVHDIHGLQRTAKLSKLVRQTKLMAHIENAMSSKLFSKRFISVILQSTTLVSSNAHGVLYVKPLNPREKRLPKDILLDVYELAKKHNKKNRHFLTHPNKRKVDENDKLKDKQIVAKNRQTNIRDELDAIKCDIKDLVNDMSDIKNMLEANHKMMVTILNKMNDNRM